MKPLNFEQTFPKTIPVPKELNLLKHWLEKNGYPISGGFELRMDDYGAIRHWFGTDKWQERFGAFGAGPDGSIYAIWKQDDKRSPIIHMGSEGQNNFVLAGSFIEFLRLLAVGYDEIGLDDLQSLPTGNDVNPNFQKWVKSTFQVGIPILGDEITKLAQSQHDDFGEWIRKACA